MSTKIATEKISAKVVKNFLLKYYEPLPAIEKIFQWIAIHGWNGKVDREKLEKVIKEVLGEDVIILFRKKL